MVGARAIYIQELEIRPCVVGTCRRSVETQLTRWGYNAMREAVSLCTVELLTNVMKHTRTQRCVLTLETDGRGVKLTVSNASRKLPVILEPNWQAVSGRGMCLISNVANSYGWGATSTGKDIWATFQPAEAAA